MNEKKVRNNLENRFQHELIMWFGQTWPEYHNLLFEVYNNPESEKHAMHRRSMGMKRNVSDLILLRPVHGQMVGLELKAPGTDWPRLKIQNQFNWGEKVIKNGGFYIMSSDSCLLRSFITAIINDDMRTVMIIQGQALQFVQNQLKNKTIKF